MLTTRRSVLTSSSLLALALIGRSLPAVAESVAPMAEGKPSNPVVFYNAQVFTAEYDTVAIRGDPIIAVGIIAPPGCPVETVPRLPRLA